MESAESFWSAAPSFFIDLLIQHLKRTRRWRRDCPSLRALNRHWCSALNQHVTEVRPHSTRDLRYTDVSVLLKFPNLTALDITAFKVECYGWRDQKMSYMASILSKLPCLRKLHVGHLPKLMDEDYHLISHITSLHYDQRRRVSQCEVANISGLPLKELSGWFSSRDLVDFVLENPTLKNLHVFTDRRLCADFIPTVQKLETISLRIFTSDLNWRMSMLTNLVSLDLDDSPPQSFEPLTGLLKLTSLRFWCREHEILGSNAFCQLRKRLKRLVLSGSGRLPIEIARCSPLLESLSLIGFRLNHEFFADLQCHSLASLSLISCQFLENPILTELSKLTGLCLLCGPDRSMLQRLDLSFFSELRRLEVEMVPDSFKKQLAHIRSLVKLESLKIELTGLPDLPVKRFKALERLPNLSSLRVSGRGAGSLLTLLAMDMMTSLEELSLAFKQKGRKHYKAIYSQAEVLKLKAPNLRFRLYLTDV